MATRHPPRKPRRALGYAAAFDTEACARIDESGFQLTLEHPLSTFWIDVDTASHSNVRRGGDFRGATPDGRFAAAWWPSFDAVIAMAEDAAAASGDAHRRELLELARKGARPRARRIPGRRSGGEAPLPAGSSSAEWCSFAHAPRVTAPLLAAPRGLLHVEARRRRGPVSMAADLEALSMGIGTPARYLTQLLVVLVAYFLTAKLGLSLDAVGGVAATVWAPSGIALAALLLGGTSLWPAVALGAFSANLSVGVPAAAAAGIAVGNTLEALLGAHLVRRFCRFRDAPLDTVRDAIVLVALAGFLSTTVSATIGATSVWLAGMVSNHDVARVWWNWWVGDVLGVLVVTPLVFGVRALPEQAWTRLRLLEAGLALAVLCAVGALIFGAEPSSRIVLHAYFVFPPLLWAALRFGQPGAAVATFALATAAILGTAAGLGPFVVQTRAESLLSLQTFMSSVALIVLVLGVMSTERAREMADRKQLESQLVVADRLAAVGTLAAGIGHEINNPLAYLIMKLGSAQEVADRMGTDGAPELRELLGTAQEGADRIRRIVSDLKALARDEGAARAPIDVHKVLDSCVRIAGNHIRHRARLLKEYGRVPAADANEGRLAQVFLNLLINASQAIPEGHVDDNFIRVVTLTDAEGNVVVELSDSGVGIEPHLQDRLFEPFFTTKPVGEGIGLGLSVCHAIVTAWGGSIAVRSDAGAGTTFRVVLPAHPDSAVAAPPPAVREASGPTSLLRVLIVEDEERLAQSLARTLRAHRVTLAGNGRDALALCKDHDYDLILCDLLMPELTGMDVYEEICRLRPGCEERVVFMTGGAFTPRAQSFLAAVPNRRLHKPFTPDELLQLVADHVRRRGLG